MDRGQQIAALAEKSGGSSELPAMASWPNRMHKFEPREILAIQAALATGRPLLLRGEPGTGKSQLAHAAAFITRRAFLPFVVGARTEVTDLHWQFDAIGRLADAQSQKGADQIKKEDYIQPGVLWWALNWGDAKMAGKCAVEPEKPLGWEQKDGVVVLLDEIDKAESDLPNGLLETFANRAFSVPLLGDKIVKCPVENGALQPLIIITTNEERDLPPAFLRRCMVLNLALPRGDELVAWLIERGRLHHPELSPGILNQAAVMLNQDRILAEGSGRYKPGLAEYLDLLLAVEELGETVQTKFEELGDFYLKKAHYE